MKAKIAILAASFFRIGVTNAAAGFQADVEAYIQEEVEPLARRQLVAYQFGKPLRLDINRGTTYTASRYERLPLPIAPLQEGVAPAGAVSPSSRSRRPPSNGATSCASPMSRT
jgi:hypothetical protein